MDYLRPQWEPAQSIYDAFQAEAGRRKGRSTEEWIAAEREAVYRAACEQAPKHGLRPPTMEEVTRAEFSAFGHVDYGSKWAYRLIEFMRSPANRDNYDE